MTLAKVRFICLRCDKKMSQKKGLTHKCQSDPKPDPLEVLECQIPVRPEAPVAPRLAARPLDYGLNLQLPDKGETP